MNYILGSFFILKNKIEYWGNSGSGEVPRVEPILPWYRQYGYFFSDSNEIIDGLFLGSSYNAYCLDKLQEKNIKVIINVTEEIDNFYQDSNEITYYKFSIKDNNSDDIIDILNQTYQIIDSNLSQGNNVLVHCYMGASRSASVIIYYLMKKLDWDYDRAKDHVTFIRPLVNLSQKFELTLKNIN